MTRASAFLLTAAASLLLSLPVVGASRTVPATPSGKPSSGKTGRPAPKPIDLMWHVETLDGEVVDSSHADDFLNPASVVKVATSLWALERLGPDYRFESRFYTGGTVDAGKGLLRGDLVVEGTGDPDFHAENAFLVAEALNRRSVRRVTGAVVVNARFWMGWEGGSAGTDADAGRRALKMATRLRQALDPNRWNSEIRSAWAEFAARRGLPRNRPFRVEVLGGVKYSLADPPDDLLLVHRGNPLVDSLRRFNCYSNNDIERVGVVLGQPADLAGILAARLGAAPDTVRLETTSGLGSNRLSPRQVVNLLRQFRQTSERLGLGVEELLPVAGCDPGTVSHFFPLLAGGANATAMVGKTGTLTATDGGVSVLAGFVNTGRGDLVFCVAAPNSGRYLHLARRSEERFVLDLLARSGGPHPRTCAPPLPSSDGAAAIVVGGRG